MAKVTNSFVTGKMNKDRDDRLLQANEYRNAMNAQVSRSEGANVGALENVLGNSVASDFRTLTSATDILSIGYCTDEINNRVFVFLTNNTSSTQYDAAAKHFIIVYNALNDTPIVLVTGSFLNFSTAFPITGVNILDNLLYFADNRNQPRVINVDLANPGSQPGINPDYYFVSEAFSDLPYDYDRPGSNRKPIHLLKSNGGITEISNQSLVINSITGINREDHKLYYPKEMILKIKDYQIKGSIINLLNELN